MKEIELISLDKKVYFEKLKNGLEIYLVPYDNKENYYISYATKFGSDVLKFDLDGDTYTPPLGIAHYLEHKMFEEPSGIDPFAFFSESGTDANAMTSYDSTQYICYGTKEFHKNLRYLLKYVNTPYFTDENVNKEKGIITEEIKMYDSLPDYKLEMKLRENIYKKLSRRLDIAGTEEEINKITKEDLYKCYNSFYLPNNMFILIVGNFNIEDAINIIKAELEEKLEYKLPKIYHQKEPVEVYKKHETIHADIETPKVGIGLKIPKKDLKLKDIELDLYLNMLMSILYGSSSMFRENARNNQLLNDIYMEWENTYDFKTFYFLATSKKPDELIEAIKQELNNIKIDENHFNRIKKVWIENEVKMIDNIEKTESNLYYDIIHHNKITPNRIELVKKMNIDKLNKLIKNIDFSNISVLKMMPNKK